MKLSKRKGWVGLEGLKVHGSVGVYESEKKNGNILELDIWVYGNLKPAIDSDKIEESINYELLEKVAIQEIEGGNHLLEPVANGILTRIFKDVPGVEKARITLKKLNPPLDNPCHASVVKLRLKRKHVLKN